MADYCKLRLITTYSDNSDYSDPVVEADWSAEYRPDEIIQRKVEAATGGTAVTATDLDDPIIALAIYNRDDTNYVEVDYTEGAAGAATPTIRVPAKGLAVIPDIDSTAAITITANTAACICDVIILGD